MFINPRRQRLNLEQVNAIGIRLFSRMEQLMMNRCEGGLSFGWDMPTFKVLFPRKHRAWDQLRHRYFDMQDD